MATSTGFYMKYDPGLTAYTTKYGTLTAKGLQSMINNMTSAKASSMGYSGTISEPLTSSERKISSKALLGQVDGLLRAIKQMRT